MLAMATTIIPTNIPMFMLKFVSTFMPKSSITTMAMITMTMGTISARP